MGFQAIQLHFPLSTCRWLLSLIGLLGPAVNNMDIRSIGMIGYAAVFPIAVALMARMFRSPALSREP